MREVPLLLPLWCKSTSPASSESATLAALRANDFHDWYFIFSQLNYSTTVYCNRLILGTNSVRVCAYVSLRLDAVHTAAACSHVSAESLSSDAEPIAM